MARSIPAHAGEPLLAPLGANRGGVYPRPRGGTYTTAPAAISARGLSPPTRGNLRRLRALGVRERSIPAHAGEPCRRISTRGCTRVYPRPRGGTGEPAESFYLRSGLSPPTRGNRVRRAHVSASSGSIPAHAGEPTARRRRRMLYGVYPRPRGGTNGGERRPSVAGGLSPPTRGNHAGARRTRSARRSIPAHAGEPQLARTQHLSDGVYPRPRGGTRLVLTLGAANMGLSPPTRGNRTRADAGIWRSGRRRGLSPPTRGNPGAGRRTRKTKRSIPAHAGEPARRDYPKRLDGVYPRPRGGTRLDCTKANPLSGLSPPTRGNQFVSAGRAAEMRSIPAHAGELDRARARRAHTAVYPRPRGGTQPLRPELAYPLGLSPPTRGNRARADTRARGHGSIPARAGEPERADGRRRRTAVYPRPRGGTLYTGDRLMEYDGLSPPTRGNQRSFYEFAEIRRSIPAHAGEPSPFPAKIVQMGVYPRPRGGTADCPVWARCVCGLSPPTRGNPGRQSGRPALAGSIPAHAGEPEGRKRNRRVRGVYPRPRGGNLPVSYVSADYTRSIPAHAGEPGIRRLVIIASGVYPRPRGGTGVATEEVG